MPRRRAGDNNLLVFKEQDQSSSQHPDNTKNNSDINIHEGYTEHNNPLLDNNDPVNASMANLSLRQDSPHNKPSKGDFRSETAEDSDMLNTSDVSVLVATHLGKEEKDKEGEKDEKEDNDNTNVDSNVERKFKDLFYKVSIP